MTALMYFAHSARSTGVDLDAAVFDLPGILNMTSAAARIRGGATSFGVTNHAGTLDNFIVSDAGIVTIRAGLTVSAGTTSLQSIVGTNLTLSGNVTVTGSGTVSITKTGLDNGILLDTTSIGGKSYLWLRSGGFDRWQVGVNTVTTNGDLEFYDFGSSSIGFRISYGTNAVTIFGSLNGQTISSAANFTGSLTIANGLTVTAGTSALQAITGTTLATTGNITHNSETAISNAGPNTLIFGVSAATVHLGSGNATLYVGNAATTINIGNNGAAINMGLNSGSIRIAAAAGSLGFYGAGATTKLAVTGSRGANAALASLLTALATIGLFTDSST